MVTEGGRLVVVDVELVRDVNAEALGRWLGRQRDSDKALCVFNGIK